MTARLDAPLRVAAVAAASALVGISFLPAASAADGDVEVVNTETIQVYTDATGKVQTKRVYEQVSMTGNGSVELVNPIETDGLRNLDEFGGFDVRDGNQVTTMTVDGEERLRSVSDYDGELPLTVDVQYFLDGTKVEPGDVVGADGRLEVLYTVTNVTAQPQEVSFPDGNGGTVTKTVDVPIPMVGSLSTVAPDNFTDVQSDQANMAGDGRGGTKLSFTMTLFPPLGSDSVEFGYSATITDGVVPRAEISALPLNPLESPTFQTAATSYQSGADTGAQLADGAATIDQNLLKLRDGASELLAGLIRLRDGSEQLEQGLAGEAAPGAALLADGAAQLSAGLGEIDSGAGRLADGTTELLAGTGELMSGAGRLHAGAGELADGAGAAAKGGRDLANGAGRLDAGLTELDGGVGELSAGAAQLSAGQQQLEEGLETLYEGVNALPQSVQTQLNANADYQRLLGGLSEMINGVGSTTQEDSLVWGVDQIRKGLERAVPGLGRMIAGIYSNSPTSPGAFQKTTCVISILKDVRDGVDAGSDTCYAHPSANPTGAHGALSGFTAPSSETPQAEWTDSNRNWLVLNSVITGLEAGLPDLYDTNPADNATDPSLYEGLNMVLAGLTSMHPDAPGAIPALTKIECGLDSTSLGATCQFLMGSDPGLRQGLGLVSGGVPQLVSQLTGNIRAELLKGIGTPTGVCDPDAPTLLCGAGALTDGGQQLAAGITKLADGVVQLSEGGSQLSAGAEELAAGLARLDAGAGKLAAGTGELKAGAKKLNDGAGRLNEGAGQLADGTGRAKDGADQIADGAGQLAQGLGEAANGSSRMTDGLETAAEGAPKLVDGAERLSNEGTKKLVEAGVDTTQTYGQMYATITAGAERAEAEKMAYGAPEGAMGLTAYSFVIEGEDGEGGRNLARGLAGLAVLGAGAGAFALRRRFI